MECNLIRNRNNDIVGIQQPNGYKSLLFNELSNKYSITKAIDIYNYLQSKPFIDRYGDWTIINKALMNTDDYSFINTDKIFILRQETIDLFKQSKLGNLINEGLLFNDDKLNVITEIDDNYRLIGNRELYDLRDESLDKILEYLVDDPIKFNYHNRFKTKFQLPLSRYNEPLLNDNLLSIIEDVFKPLSNYIVKIEDKTKSLESFINDNQNISVELATEIYKNCFS